MNPRLSVSQLHSILDRWGDRAAHGELHDRERAGYTIIDTVTKRVGSSAKAAISCPKGAVSTANLFTAITFCSKPS